MGSRKKKTLNSERRLPGESQKGSCVRDNKGRSVGPGHVQCSEREEDGEGNSVATEPSYPLALKLGSSTPDLIPRLLPGLPGVD